MIDLTNIKKKLKCVNSEPYSEKRSLETLQNKGVMNRSILDREIRIETM